MADRIEYWKLLRDPRWQKMRLNVMGRDEFKCQRCGSKDKTLNVHHSYYEKDNMPWEYPEYSLHTLCEDCHKIEHEQLVEFRRELGRIGQSGFDQIRGYLLGLKIQESEVEITILVNGHWFATGVAHAYGLLFSDLSLLVNDSPNQCVTNKQLFRAGIDKHGPNYKNLLGNG